MEDAMQISEIMSSNVQLANPNQSIREIAQIMAECDCGAVPIGDNDRLVGIITDRDIAVRCIAAGNDPAETEADEVLSGDLVTVESDDDVDQAARIMADHQIRRLPVVEDGRLIGMVSLGDIAVKEDERRAGGALENISEGVKGGGVKKPSKRETQPAQGGGTRGKVQSISNRDRDLEMEGQKKVNPPRAAVSSSKRRRTG
jgi:CBS domain-containing protein